tara:strand:+ start:1030 stop:1275 length:246 start_codon:yes stop_codon:yes gene_type:complete
MLLSPKMKLELIGASIEFWIDYNYEVAHGRKTGCGVFEWLDDDEEDDYVGELRGGYCDPYCYVGGGAWCVCSEPKCILRKT